MSDPIGRLLQVLAEQMPREEVEAVYAFPPVRREGQEHGVAVVSRLARGAGVEEGGEVGSTPGARERRRVYRARYVMALKGPDRGKVTVSLEETAEAPAALLPEVLEGVRRRADEAGEAAPVDLSAWKAATSERIGPT